MSDNTQLSNTKNFNVSNITLSKPETSSIPNSQPPITFQRIKIGVKNPDGTYGDLIFKTEFLFSFGVQENKDMKTGEVNGYSMPLCMWNKNGASEDEKRFTDVHDSIVEHLKKHLVKNKEDVGLYDLEMSDLKKFNPLYWKRELGKIVKDKGPTLYAKLIVSKKKGNQIMTGFYNAETDEKLNPLDLKGKYCHVEAALKYESIFVGSKPSLQIKMVESLVKVLDSSNRRLLSRPTADHKVTVASNDDVQDGLGGDSESDDDSDEDSDGSLEEEVAVKKKTKRRVVKKRG